MFDGGFPDLAKHVLKCLKTLDPKFRTTEDFNKASPEEVQKANAEVLDFLDDMDKQD